ncbi:type II toxin-antitoxin system HigA family antitoxin [Brevundimonas staleyi]|uniref:Type II toxin-antitoxin system HigA family antitoxin n=1 Tax=Brevundimonas staleyi TaxID=74326 RepID=A0ABW0FQD3_9CAUL
MTPFTVRVIHDDEQLAAAMAAYEAFFDAEPEPGTPEGDRFELLGLVIAAYEERRWPIGAADPREVLRLVMEGRGYGQADLAALLGSRSRASEILNGRRGLSVDHIRTISAAWGVPAGALIGTAQAA